MSQPPVAPAAPFPPTDLEARYRALTKVTGPKAPRGWSSGEIAAEFDQSLRQLELLLNGTGPFHDGFRKPLPDAAEVITSGTIAGTNELVALLDSRVWAVDEEPSLGFRYLDREISPARAVIDGKPRYLSSPIAADLLLANAVDCTPIVGELKIKTDKDPEAALLQGLVYATLLAPRTQRERLHALYPGVFTRGVPACLDVYIVLHKMPVSRQPLLDSAIELAAELVAEPTVACAVHRICFLDAYLHDGGLRFRASATLTSS